MRSIFGTHVMNQLIWLQFRSYMTWSTPGCLRLLAARSAVCRRQHRCVSAQPAVFEEPFCVFQKPRGWLLPCLALLGLCMREKLACAADQLCRVCRRHEVKPLFHRGWISPRLALALRMVVPSGTATSEPLIRSLTLFGFMLAPPCCSVTCNICLPRIYVRLCG